MDQPRFWRFGAFELDVRAGELRKHGTRIRLQDQSFQILLMLLEQPGEVVLRTEISRRLWPDEMIADADQSINAAMRRLRSALMDSAEEPRFLETVAKRGYRFIAEVERVEEGAASAGIAPAMAPLAAVADTAPAPPVPDRKKPLRLRWHWAAAVLITACLGTGYRLVGWRKEARLPFRGPIPLTTFTGLTTYPSFSPDGEKVAFAWLTPGPNGARVGFSIFIKPVGNGDPERISAGPNDQLPKWSPDGTQIAFQRATKMDHELIVAPVGGGPERKIAEMGIGLSWSPDGKEIAYVAPYAPHGSGALLVQNLQTGQVRQLTHPEPNAEGLVAWSPDGKLIAFARTLAAAVYELFVVPSAGGNARRLTFDKTITDGFAWTSDSRELVFASHRSGTAALWRIRVSGGEPEPLGVTVPNPAHPAISSRGDRLAFADSLMDSNIWLYELPSRGSPSTPATVESPRCIVCSTVQDREPQYSPDGRKIAFTSERSGASEIWVADSDGSYPIQLTSAGSSLAGNPRWSPDGRWIAYEARIDGNSDIFIISAQGGKPRRLTTEPSSESTPSWSHDGRWVYFASDRADRRNRIWKAPFAGGAAVQVTKGEAATPMESADGKRLYFYGAEGHLASMPVEGGPEETIPELAYMVRTRAWTVSGDGIYFYQPKEKKPFVWFFSFATRKVTSVLAPAKPALTTAPGLDLSPDGRKLLYTQMDQRIEGLKMLENFR